MSWPLVPLKDVAFFQEGPGVRNWQFRTKGIKLINVKNIVNEVLDTSNSDKYLDPEEVSEKYEHFLADAGDLVMASSGATWGKTAWVEKKHLPLCMNTSMIRFKSLDKNRMDLSFLRYYLKTAEFRSSMEKLITGSAQPNFGSSHLKRIEIPLPPLPEQKRIAAILDKADAIRRKRQQAIKLADEFLRSVFLDMFGDPVTNPKGWDVKPLIELIDKERPITYGILKPGSDVEGGVPYVRVVDMKEGVVLSDQVRRTTPEIATQYKRSSLRRGDLLLSIRGHVGRLAVVPSKLEGANITQDTARLAPNEQCSPLYLFACLGTHRMQMEMQRFVKGAAVQGINLADVKLLEIPVPPIDLQVKIERKIGLMTRIIRKLESSSLASSSHFNSISQSFFSG